MLSPTVPADRQCFVCRNPSLGVSVDWDNICQNDKPHVAPDLNTITVGDIVHMSGRDLCTHQPGPIACNYYVLITGSSVPGLTRVHDLHDAMPLEGVLMWNKQLICRAGMPHDVQMASPLAQSMAAHELLQSNTPVADLLLRNVLEVAHAQYDDEYLLPKHLPRQVNLPGLQEGEDPCTVEQDMLNAKVRWITAGIHMVKAPCEGSPLLNKAGVAPGLHIMVVQVEFQPAWSGLEPCHVLDSYQARDRDKYMGAPCMAKWYQPCDDGKFHWYPAFISNVYESEKRFEVTWKNPHTYSPVMACHSSDVCQIGKPVAMVAPPLQLPETVSVLDTDNVSRTSSAASSIESHDSMVEEATMFPHVGPLQQRYHVKELVLQVVRQEASGLTRNHRLELQLLAGKAEFKRLFRAKCGAASADAADGSNACLSIRSEALPWLYAVWLHNVLDRVDVTFKAEPRHPIMPYYVTESSLKMRKPNPCADGVDTSVAQVRI